MLGPRYPTPLPEDVAPAGLDQIFSHDSRSASHLETAPNAVSSAGRKPRATRRPKSVELETRPGLRKY